MAKTHLILDQTSLIQSADDVVACDLDGELVLLNLSSGIYFGLNRIGAVIYSQLDAPRRFAEIVDVLLERYSIDRVTCEAQVTEFLEQMADSELIRVTTESAKTSVQ